MKPKLVVWGAGGHAMVIADIIRLCGEFELVGFLDDVDETRRGTQFCGVPVLGGKEKLDDLPQSGVRHLIIGFADCTQRLSRADLVLTNGFSLATAIHPQASIADGVLIGPGTVVKAMVVIEPSVTIGKNVIIGARSLIAHESVVEDGVHISGGGNVGGRVRIGRGAWIGIGATVKDRVTVGAGTQIGAGSAVVEDIPDGVVAFGVPARPIWKRGLWSAESKPANS